MATTCGSKKRKLGIVGFNKDAEVSCEKVSSCLSALKEAAQFGSDDEGKCFELGVALEKRGEWRLAWELLFGLVEHLGAKTVSEMYAHAAVRCASLFSRAQGVAPVPSIPTLCAHLRICFITALEQKTGRFPSPRKLLEWMVHVTLPLNGSEVDTRCWKEVQQALIEGGQKAMRTLMEQRSAEEQTQLLRLLGHHARNVQPAAADVVADILQRLLAQLAQKESNEFLQGALSKPNDAAIWLKTIASTLEALMMLSHSRSWEVLDWADDFLGHLAAAQFPLRLQPLYSLVCRGRLRALEAVRGTVSRAEIFDAWKLPVLQQLQSLLGQRIQGADREVAAKLQPLFQLSGLLREAPDHFGHRAQCLESLRLQLPPGPISAILALCQLQFHCQSFTANRLTSASAAQCSSFGRLVISLITDADFRKAVNSGLSTGPSGSSVALQAVGLQLQRCIDRTEASAPLRLLQAQARALQTQIDGDQEDCKELMTLALENWKGILAVEWCTERTPCSLIQALQSAGETRDLDHLLARDLSDAAHLLEMQEQNALCMRALALCLACMVQQYGRNALCWLQGAPHTLPRNACEVGVILLYRMAAAAGRLDQDGQCKEVAEWWKLAEARKANLGDVPPIVLTQRMTALSCMPESLVLSQWPFGGCRWETFADGAGLEDGLMFAEAFCAWSKWSAQWLSEKDLHHGQCPGGNAVASQTAALRALKLLFHGPKVSTRAALEAHSHELLRWPMWRSGLLQLRILHQVSLLYDRLGETDLAAACADCGLQLLEQKLCGDSRWKLRFLCLRSRCVSRFSGVKEENDLHQIEELWNRRIQGQPLLDLTTPQGEESTNQEAELDDAISIPGMPLELLTFLATTSSKCRSQRTLLRLLSQVESKVPSERLVLLMQLQMDHRSDVWTATVERLLDCIANHPEKAPFPRALWQALALLAQALFNDLTESKKSWSLLKTADELEQCCMALEAPALPQLADIQAAPSLKSFLRVCAVAMRGALFMGDSAAARHCAQLLLRVEDLVKGADTDLSEEGSSSRSRSPQRKSGRRIFSRAFWKLCKQVVSCGAGVSLLFITELRARQRRLEELDHQSALTCLSDRSTSVPGVMTVEDICSGNWMSQVSDMSLAWLQVDWKSSSLQIARWVDPIPGTPTAQEKLVLSHRLPARLEVLENLQDELQRLHRSNNEKIKELWQRQDKKSEAVRLEFWRSRKGFDEELGRLLEKIQKEVLSVGRFLLAPWPQSDVAREYVLDALHSWLSNEAPAISERVGRCSEEPEHFFLLALLLMEAENMEVSELLAVLGQLWDGGRSALRRLAYSMRRYSCELRNKLKEFSEVPLLLYVDGVMARLPLEATPCLRQRHVARGLAPSITLSALASKSSSAHQTTGFFVIDPSEDCAAMGDVRQLLSSWRSDGWQGHTGQLPDPKRVLEELCRKDVFVYLGHGERARQLLRHEKLQIAGAVVEESDRCKVSGLRSVLMLLGCSSVKIQRGSFEIESFGLASSALLGGAPLVLGAQWDVLGGDLDKLASRLLQRWLKGETGPQSKGLLAALKELRPKCLLPNLTGAALVCYGIPV